MICNFYRGAGNLCGLPQYCACKYHTQGRYCSVMNGEGVDGDSYYYKYKRNKR